MKIEKQILGLGYASVDDYNARINKAYNEPARASVEKNANATVVSAKDTYTVEEAAVKSGAMVKVHIEHNFEGTDISYVEDFEIDRNDILTVNSIAALGNATQPGYASLYYNTRAKTRKSELRKKQKQQLKKKTKPSRHTTKQSPSTKPIKSSTTKTWRSTNTT